MASKKTDKNADKPKKGGGIMGLLPKVFGLLAVLSATVLFAAAFDVGHFGLFDMIEPLAIVPLSLFFLMSIAQLFMGGGKGGGDAVADETGLAESLSDFQSKTASRFAALQNSIDAMSGHDYDSLVAENRELKEQLDAIHEAAREKVDNEVEMLRAKNRELEEKIKDWAVQTVANAVGDKADDAAEAG